MNESKQWTTRVPVTEPALVQRINRKLAASDETLRKNRRGWDPDIGTYYVIDYRSNVLVRKDVDLETLGRELGVFEEWETLAEAKAAKEGGN